MTGPGAGSSGTETNGMQLLKGSTILIKNGTLEFEDDRLRMGIQNYSDLTLDNVKVISKSDKIQYVVSNNYGNVVFKNKTSITATANNVAFDCWYGMNQIYDDPGVFVTIADDTVQINGRVEFGKQDRASEANFAEHASITCPSDMDLNVDVLNPPCEWVTEGDVKTLKYQLQTAEVEPPSGPEGSDDF